MKKAFAASLVVVVLAMVSAGCGKNYAVEGATVGGLVGTVVSVISPNSSANRWIAPGSMVAGAVVGSMIDKPQPPPQQQYSQQYQQRQGYQQSYQQVPLEVWDGSFKRTSSYELDNFVQQRQPKQVVVRISRQNAPEVVNMMSRYQYDVAKTQGVGGQQQITFERL
ncbi:MAG: hypothetical protein FWF46_02845 [Oscillospiraceae bacterium]|nr:hypothetical protein [Oscillospiraceae bacterium]